MRKDFGVQNWLFPMPVLLVGTYDADGNANIMNAAWGGIHDTHQLAVCIDPGHKTAANLQLKQCFTVSIGTAPQVAAADYVGLASGKDTPDKVAKAGLTPRKAAFVDAPVFDELPMTLECKVISYDDKTGCTVAQILNVSADESVLDEKGSIDPAKLRPITYDPVHHLYRELGAIAGQAFHDGLVLKGSVLNID